MMPNILQKPFGTTDTAPQRLENGMKHQHGKFQYLDRSTDGLLSQALTNSMVLSVARPINGNR